MCWGLGGSQTAARVGVLLLEQRQRPGREGGRFLPGNHRVTHWEHNPLGPESAVCAEEVAQGRGEAGPESPL